MPLSKAFSMIVIATILIGIGALTSLSISGNAHDHGIHSAAVDAHHHGDVEKNNSPSKHKHPNNQDNHQGNCHSLACSSSAAFTVSATSFMNTAGDRIPLLTIAFARGLLVPPSEHPPKLSA